MIARALRLRHRFAWSSWPLPVIGALAMLCAATYFGLNTAARYTIAAVGVAPGSAPPSDLRRWQSSRTDLDFAVDDGVIVARLVASGAGAVPVLRAPLAIPDGADAMRVTLDLGAQAIEAGDRAWQRGQVQILSFDQDGRFLWYWPKEIVSAAGDRPYGPASAIVPVGPELKFALLVIYNGADSGVLRVGPPQVVALAERPVFTILRYALILAWILAGLWIARALMDRAASKARAGLLFGAILIALGGTLMPQPVFRTVSAPVEAWAASLADTLLRPAPALDGAPMAAKPGRAPPSRSTTYQRDAGQPLQNGLFAPAAQEADYPFSFKQLSHFAAFFLLGLAGAAAFPLVAWPGRLAGLGSFAVATESLQWFVVTRSGMLSDLSADAAGLVMAALTAAAISRLMAGARARHRTRAAPGASP